MKRIALRTVTQINADRSSIFSKSQCNLCHNFVLWNISKWNLKDVGYLETPERDKCISYNNASAKVLRIN